MPDLIVFAAAARTAEDLQHLNTLVPPAYGVTAIRLKTSGGKTSASNTFAGAVAGSEAAFAFAPGRKAGGAVDPLDIVYTIDDPGGAARKGRLELFRRFQPAPAWSLDLTAAQLRDGMHTIPWDGFLAAAIAPDKEDESKAQYTHTFQGSGAGDANLFPDSFVTAAESPYRLKITLGGDSQGDPPTAWTDFHILLHSIELELGLKDTLSRQIDKDLWDALGNSLPAPGAVKRVPLKSNLYKMTGTEMNDNTLFTAYKTLWADGPNIPLFAKVFVKNSQGAKETAPEAAVALGNARFLWDYEDVPEVTTTNSRPPVKTFVDLALDYDKAKTRPKGDNCHQERGGKRGERPALIGAARAPAAPVFPKQDGEDAAGGHQADRFPFKVEPCERATRFWSATSTAWTQGALAGKTGVLFQPARASGDAYKVHVYFAYDRDKAGKILMDADADIDAVIKASTGTFEIWRQINIARYLRKNNVINDLFAGGAWGSIQAWYNETYIEVVPPAAASKTFLVPIDYNEKATDALKSGLGDDSYSFMVNVAINQYDGNHALTFNDYNALKRAVRRWYRVNNPTQDPLEAFKDADAWVATEFPTAADYNQHLNDISADIVEAVLNGLDPLNGADDGVSIVEFAGLQNQPSARITLGAAIDVVNHTRSRCLFMGFIPNPDTIAHEIGHHLMCPHAHGVIGDTQASGIIDTHHDKDDTHCLMSYSRPRSTFCGMCQLRLRGWDLDKLDKDGAKNKKP